MSILLSDAKIFDVYGKARTRENGRTVEADTKAGQVKGLLFEHRGKKLDASGKETFFTEYKILVQDDNLPGWSADYKIEIDGKKLDIINIKTYRIGSGLIKMSIILWEAE